MTIKMYENALFFPGTQGFNSPGVNVPILGQANPGSRLATIIFPTLAQNKAYRHGVRGKDERWASSFYAQKWSVWRSCPQQLREAGE